MSAERKSGTILQKGRTRIELLKYEKIGIFGSEKTFHAWTFAIVAYKKHDYWYTKPYSIPFPGYIRQFRGWEKVG